MVLEEEKSKNVQGLFIDNILSITEHIYFVISKLLNLLLYIFLNISKHCTIEFKLFAYHDLVFS